MGVLYLDVGSMGRVTKKGGVSPWWRVTIHLCPCQRTETMDSMDWCIEALTALNKVHSTGSGQVLFAATKEVQATLLTPTPPTVPRISLPMEGLAISAPITPMLISRGRLDISIQTNKPISIRPTLSHSFSSVTNLFLDTEMPNHMPVAAYAAQAAQKSSVQMRSQYLGAHPIIQPHHPPVCYRIGQHARVAAGV